MIFWLRSKNRYKSEEPIGYLIEKGSNNYFSLYWKYGIDSPPIWVAKTVSECMRIEEMHLIIDLNTVKNQNIEWINKFYGFRI